MRTKFLFKLTALCCLTTFFLQGQTVNTLPFYEDNDYTIGKMFANNANQGVGNWYTNSPRSSTRHNVVASPTWTLSSNIADASGNAINLDRFGENPALYFTPQTGNFGDLYVSMFIQIDAISSSYAGGDGFEVFELRGNSSTESVGTVVARRRDDKVEFGINEDNTSSTNVWSGVLHDAGDQLFLVFSFSRTAVNGTSSRLWINPVVNGTEPTPTAIETTSDADDFSRLKIHTINTAGTPDMTIDEVRIAKTWNAVAPQKPLGGPEDPTITMATTPEFPVYESFDNYAMAANLIDANAETGIGAWGTKDSRAVPVIEVVATPTWGTVGIDTGVNNTTGKAISFKGAGEDSFLQFTKQQGKVYASFLMKVTDVSSLNTTPYRFVGFARKNSTSTTSATHLFIKKGTTGYNIGINEDNGNSDIPTYVGGVTPTEYAENTELFVVIYYDKATGELAKLWINPVLTSAEPTPDATDDASKEIDVDALLFTLNNNANTPGVTFDEIRISDNWSDVTNVLHIGSSPGNWGNPITWDNNLVPGKLSNVFVNSNLNIPSTTDAIAHNLTVNNNLIMFSGASLRLTGKSTGNIDNLVFVSDSDWHLISSTMVGQIYDDSWVTTNNIASGSTTATNRGIATYDNGTPDATTGPWRYMQAGDSETFEKTQGYSLKKIGAGDYLFTGTFPRANYNYPITQSVSNWNLLGNPYPSYLKIADLISANTAELSSAFQAIYVWNPSAGTSGEYQQLTTGVIHPGQAFFVNSNVASGVFKVTEAMQSAREMGSVFYRNEDAPNFTLQISSGKEIAKTAFTLSENATNGLNPGQDFGMFNGVPQAFGVYSHLVEGNTGVPLKTQALGLSTSSEIIIPIGIIAKKDSELTFSAEQFNLPSDVTLYLEDKVTNAFINLSEKDGEYAVKLNEDTNGTGRFFIHTANRVLSVDEVLLSNVSIYQANNTLKISGLEESDFSVSVYSLLGKEVLSTKQNSNNAIKEVALPTLSRGIYVVKLETATSKISKKIILR